MKVNTTSEINWYEFATIGNINKKMKTPQSKNETESYWIYLNLILWIPGALFVSILLVMVLILDALACGISSTLLTLFIQSKLVNFFAKLLSCKLLLLYNKSVSLNTRPYFLHMLNVNSFITSGIFFTIYLATHYKPPAKFLDDF